MTGRSALLLVTSFAACKPEASAPSIETVGDPLSGWRTSPSEAYARNLWDLREFAGHLYLGHGDAIVNTGPTPVLTFDPSSQVFTEDTVVNEEAVTSLRVFGDRLYLPGADSVSLLDGALYVRDAIEWRTILLPGVVHASDVFVHGAELCVAVQDVLNGGAVRCSRDDGATWSEYSTGGFRAVSLFQLGDALHVSSHDVGVHRIEGGLAPVKLALEGVDPRADVLVTKAVRCGDELVFIAKQVTYTEPPEVLVFGLFHTPDVASRTIAATRTAMRGTPADLFVKNGQCYAVTNQPNDAGGYDVTIERSEDGRAWHRTISFANEAMVRSAELLNGRFYLGTGCEIGHCSAAAGQLLSVQATLRSH